MALIPLYTLSEMNIPKLIFLCISIAKFCLLVFITTKGVAVLGYAALFPCSSAGAWFVGQYK